MSKFIIASFESGLFERGKAPYLLPKDAFVELNNALVYKGKIKSRYGTYPISILSGDVLEKNRRSRLRIKLGTTTSGGNFSYTDSNILGKLGAGQFFSVEDRIYTVFQDGSMKAYPGSSGSVNYANGSVTLSDSSGSSGLAVYYYPCLPIVGLQSLDTGIANNNKLIAFDNHLIYEFTGSNFEAMDSSGGGKILSSGNSYNLVSTTNVKSPLLGDQYMLAVNNTAGHMIKIHKLSSSDWENKSFYINKDDANSNKLYVYGGRIIKYFKGRTIIFAPIIGNNQDPGLSTKTVRLNNTAFYSEPGDPTGNDSWKMEKGKGGQIVASTSESIITVSEIRDRLIVFFESSTWELVFTGEIDDPFYWQQIDSNLGAESSQSIVNVYDTAVAIGRSGIHSTDGSKINRIDEKIPEKAWQIRSLENGTDRVYGARDYYNELIYWSFPDLQSKKFPNKVLIYNYKEGSWASADDSVTCFGNIQNRTSYNWSQVDWSWSSWTGYWESSTYESLEREVVAGSQNGFVSIMGNYAEGNSASTPITDISVKASGFTQVTCIDHNFKMYDLVQFYNCNGMEYLNNKIYHISRVVDKDNFIIPADITGSTYNGGGLIEFVPVPNIKSKAFNFGLEKGRQSFISDIDFLVEKSRYGKLTVDFYPSSSDILIGYSGDWEGATLGKHRLDFFPYALNPLEKYQSALWHKVYLQSEGSTLSMDMTKDVFLDLDDSSVLDVENIKSSFQIFALIFNVEPSAPL